jgi:hypothetical protein
MNKLPVFAEAVEANTVAIWNGDLAIKQKSHHNGVFNTEHNFYVKI